MNERPDVREIDDDTDLDRAERDTDTRSEGARTRDVPTIAEEEKDDVELLNDDALDDLRRRWNDVQAGFVDEPKAAVENADRLVEETVRRLTGTFANERKNLEQTWSRGEEASTEDLRIALQRYRSFFNRLLST
jgi:hypothetical protein